MSIYTLEKLEEKTSYLVKLDETIVLSLIDLLYSQDGKCSGYRIVSVINQSYKIEGGRVFTYSATEKDIIKSLKKDIKSIFPNIIDKSV